MNTNLLAIVKQIIAEQGEGILDDPKRLKAFFADYAKDEPKQERLAFGRCVEMGCYAELKGCGSVEERQHKKTELATALHRNTGIERPYCADALDLMEVVIFGEQEKNLCKNCGKEMQAGWKSCPFCVVATADAVGEGKGKTRYYLSYNYKETGPYDRAAIEAMAVNGQISDDYFVRADNSAEWKPITTLCKFPKTPKAVQTPEYQSSYTAQRKHESAQKNSKKSSGAKSKEGTSKSGSTSPGKSRSKETLISYVVGTVIFLVFFGVAMVLIDIFFGFLGGVLYSSGIGDVLDNFFRGIIHGD